MKKSQIGEYIFNILTDLEDYLQYGFKTKKNKIDFSFLDKEDFGIKETKKEEIVNNTEKNNNTNFQSKKEMVELAFRIVKCERCILTQKCKNKVPGIGNIPAKILVVSGYLTSVEEKEKSPLNKKELELLYKWFDAISIPNNQIFITSILKCANYDIKIERDYIEKCRYYLDRQIEILKPLFIFTIGDVALSSLKRQKAENKNFHGTEFVYNNLRSFTTYHPKDMLKNNELKKVIWGDLKKFKSIFFKD